MIFIFLIIIILLLNDRRGSCNNSHIYNIGIGIIFFLIIFHIAALFFGFRYLPSGIMPFHMMRGMGGFLFGC